MERRRSTLAPDAEQFTFGAPRLEPGVDPRRLGARDGALQYWRASTNARHQGRASRPAGSNAGAERSSAIATGTRERPIGMASRERTAVTGRLTLVRNRRSSPFCLLRVGENSSTPAESPVFVGESPSSAGEGRPARTTNVRPSTQTVLPGAASEKSAANSTRSAREKSASVEASLAATPSNTFDTRISRVLPRKWQPAQTRTSAFGRPSQLDAAESVPSRLETVLAEDRRLIGRSPMSVAVR